MLLALALPGAAAAAPVLYFGRLNGAAESPATISAGTGFAQVTIDGIANTMRVQVSFIGLTSNTTAAHIHCCTTTPGSGNIGVATMTPAFTGFPIGVTSGTMDHTFDLTDAATYNATYVANNGGTAAGAAATLLNGIEVHEAYLNIHTTTYPGGEIRAFLIPDKLFASGFESPS